MKVDPFALPRVEISKLAELPACSGIYFVLSGNSVLYIGQSRNIRKRLKYSHHRINQIRLIQDGFVSYLKSEKQDLDFVERRMIKIFSPKWNREDVEKVVCKRGYRKAVSVKLSRKTLSHINYLSKRTTTASYIIEDAIEHYYNFIKAQDKASAERHKRIQSMSAEERKLEFDRLMARDLSK